MTEQQTVISQTQQENRQQQGFCKNHSDTKSCYFSVEQPWVKYCQNCALNMALCGKKIEKQLNSKEFSNKLVLSSLMIDLTNMISQADQASKNYLKLVAILQKNNGPFKQKLIELDDLIVGLTQKKEELAKFYQRTITNKISECYERQNNLALAQTYLRKYVETIQCNYTNLLNQQEAKIEQNVQFYQLKIQNCKQFMPVSDYNETILKNIHQTAQKFKFQFEKLGKFRIDMGWLKEYGIDLASKQNSKQKANRIYSVTVQNKQNFHNSIFDCLQSKVVGSTNISGRSSTIASGLQSIADLEPILHQIDGKRQNRAHLQLRCTKTKQKRQKSVINVDVRQQRKSSSGRVKTNF